MRRTTGKRRKAKNIRRSHRFFAESFFLSGEEKFCKSDAEYNDLIKTYMERN